MALSRSLVIIGLLLAAAGTGSTAEPQSAASSVYAQWPNGPDKDPSYFPIGVWLQDPSVATVYQKAGINLYVGLWQGPTEMQLHALKKQAMPVVCAQNSAALTHKNDPIIVGWLQQDEPDNAQSLGKNKGFGPPVPPADIVKFYASMRKSDPTRPVFVNFGEGAAWDGPRSRGERVNHPEDYAEYMKGCDIATYAIYPASSANPMIKGDLDFIAQGAERLVKWGEGKKIVWACIECTKVNSGVKASPKQVKAEVWIALTHGCMGIVYFVHEFKPHFSEQALLNDHAMLAAVTATNKQIDSLARALNSPTVADGVSVESSDANVPVAAMAKNCDGVSYVFAVAMKSGQTLAEFTVKGLPAKADVEVIGEKRTIDAVDGKFADRFVNWDVHLYRIPAATSDKPAAKP